MAKLYDKTGREIMVGDVLKVYHFTAALRRKKHFMYKQVIGQRASRSGTPMLDVSHLDMTGDYYVLVCDGTRLPDHEIVQSIDCKHEERPRRALEDSNAE